jgi:hypothetical protein
MIGRRVAGLAAVVSEMDRPLMAQLNEYRIPTVFFDVGWQCSQIANIRVDYQREIKKLIALSLQPGASQRRLCWVSQDVGSDQQS